MRPDRSVSLGEVLPEGEACVYTTQVVKGSSHSVHNILERRIPASARASAASARASPDDQMAPSGARGFLPSAPDLHSDAVTHLKMLRSPFGSRLLSASRDGVIKVWC
ncbi:hypothetical protein T484DRAFT_2248572 [Baffinella frigidus]|nr:hypothetical protein T484DRAFT_2248572 [Cryptophyta sp. CCMP2293]